MSRQDIPRFPVQHLPVAADPSRPPTRPLSRSPEETWREQVSAVMRQYSRTLLEVQQQTDRIEATLARIEEQYETIQASLKELLNRPKY